MTPFVKDILVIDFEVTGVDPKTALPIQVGLVLLDKQTLAEKASFTSYISNDLTNADPESLRISGVTAENLVGAPTMAEIGKIIYNQFGTDILLASWVNRLDRPMLQKLVEAAGLNFMEYDYHFLDLWPPAYVYLLKNGYTGTIHSEDMFTALGLPKRGSHDALEDCRHAAEALRKILE